MSQVLHVIVCIALLGSAVLAGAEETVVAQAGGFEISAQDVERRMGVERAYGNSGIAAETALAALVNDAFDRAAARAAGVEAAPAEIAALNQHATESSRAPEILNKVKAVFGNDTAAFERIYLAPKINGEKLRAFYSTNPEIHKTERAAIEAAYALAAGGKAFDDIVPGTSLKHTAFDCEDKQPELPPELKKTLPPEAYPKKDPLLLILEKLAVGEIAKTIVEDDSSYKVVKLAAKNGPTYTVDAIVCTKRPFEAWFQEQAAKFPIEINDAGLKQKIVAKYPNVWWVKRLAVQPEIKH